MSKRISIDIVLDTVCPWCYVGKRRLENAISQYKAIRPEVTFEVKYSPYQLDPYRTTTSDKLEHYKNKFGESRVMDIINRMKETTEPLGININYGGVISNTFDSHRLIWWSKQFNKQPDLVEQLCKLYFDENKDIGDHNSLVAAAEKAGLDKQKAAEFLTTSEGTNEIKQALKRNEINQISGVPHYTFDERFAVSGAQEPEVFIRVFDYVLKNNQ